MPQLDKSSFLNQVLWLVIFLVILYFLIILIVLPTIHKVIAMRKLILTNIVQKGYLFSHQIIKRSKFNEMFNYTLVYFNSLMFVNVLIIKKLIKHMNMLQQKFVVVNMSNLINFKAR